MQKISIDLKSYFLCHLDIADFSKTKIKIEQVCINTTRHIVSSSPYIIIV